MLRLLLVAFCLFLTLCAAHAQSEPARAILARLEASYTIYDWDAAIGAVESDPPAARELGAWLVGRLASGDPDVPTYWQFFACFIARVLERSQQAGELPALLESKGLILPESTWEKSPLAAQPLQNLVTREQVLELAPALPKAEALATMGHYKAAYDRLEPLIGRISEYGYAGQPFDGELVKLTVLCQRLAYALHEHYNEMPADRVALEIQRAGQAHDPETQAFLSMLMVASAGRHEQPEALRENLARGRELARQGLPAFVVESWAARDRILQNPEMSLTELRQLHDAVWKHFQMPAGETPVLLFDHAARAAELWIRALGARREPEARALMEEDLARIERLGRQSAEASNLEGVLTLGGCLLEAAELELDRARPVEARKWLERSRPLTVYPYLSLQEKKDELSQTFLQGYPSRNAMRYHLVALRLAELEKEGLDGLLRETALAVEAMQHRSKSDPAAQVELVVGLAETDLSALEAEIPGLSEMLDFNLQAAVLYYGEAYQNDRPRLTRALIGLGRFEAAHGKAEQAIAHLTEAVSLIEDHINALGVAPDAAKMVRERYRPVYELLARLQLSSGKKEEAFVTLARLRQVEAVANLRGEDLGPGDAQLEKERNQLAAAQGHAGSKLQSEVIARTRQEFLSTLRRLDQADVGYRQLAVRPVEFGRIQQSIPPDTAVIQLFPSEKTLYLFVATRESLMVREVQIARTELEALVAEFRKSVARQSRSQTGWDWASPDGEALTETLTRLYAALVAPLEADVQGKRVLAFIPTDDLAYLPLGSLARLKDGKLRFLAEDHPVVTLVSSSDLTQLDRAPRDSRGSLLALGNPDGTLPGAQSEVQELKQFFPRSQVFVGPEARWSRLEGASAQPVGCLHLATHGVLNGANPLDSYLVMAGQPDKAKLSDVSALELSQVGLVTLSACQTALGDKKLELGQEIFSLSQGFGYAGVRSIIASLWKVDDGATRELMTTFYRELAGGKSRAEALQAAQVSVLSQGKYQHPFYWSSFVLMGDWR